MQVHEKSQEGFLCVNDSRRSKYQPNDQLGYSTLWIPRSFRAFFVPITFYSLWLCFYCNIQVRHQLFYKLYLQPLPSSPHLFRACRLLFRAHSNVHLKLLWRDKHGFPVVLRSTEFNVFLEDLVRANGLFLVKCLVTHCKFVFLVLLL